MKCPRDGKTRMQEGSDYLNQCPHCGVERYAVQRNINDLVRENGGVFDFTKPLEKVLETVSEGFKPLVARAYKKVNRT